MLQPKLDVADGEGADADSVPAGTERHALGLGLDTLDSGRRHGVDVGGDLELLRCLEVLPREHLQPGLGGDQRDVASGEGITATFVAAAIRRDETLAEASLESGCLPR